MGSETECELGVVDLSDENIMKPGSKEWISACRVAGHGLEQHGCFIVLYDKADRVLCNSMISAMNHLFDLPLETKMQETSPKILHSYYGQYPLLPLYESLGIHDPITMEGIHKFAHIMWPQEWCLRATVWTKNDAILSWNQTTICFDASNTEKQKCMRQIWEFMLTLI